MDDTGRQVDFTIWTPEWRDERTLYYRNYHRLHRERRNAQSLERYRQDKESFKERTRQQREEIRELTGLPARKVLDMRRAAREEAKAKGLDARALYAKYGILTPSERKTIELRLSRPPVRKRDGLSPWAKRTLRAKIREEAKEKGVEPLALYAHYGVLSRYEEQRMILAEKYPTKLTRWKMRRVRAMARREAEETGVPVKELYAKYGVFLASDLRRT